MSDETNPLPPVPQHTPPVDEISGQRKFARNWMQWFVQLREKVNAINESLVSLGVVSSEGFLTKLSGGSWASRSFEDSEDIEFTNGDGDAGNPSALLTASGVTAGTYGDATHVPVLDVDSKGRIVDASLVEISGGGGGGGGSLVLVATKEVTGAPANNLQFLGLDLATDEKYVLDFRLKNATTSNNDVSIRYNGDTNVSNYNNQRVTYNGSSAAPGRSTDSLIASMGSSEECAGTCEVTPGVGGSPRAFSNMSRSSGAGVLSQNFWVVWNSSANVTQIDVSGTQNFTVGSKVRLFKVSN